jgi:hypothetical protein
VSYTQKFDAGLHERLVGVPFLQIEFGSKFMAVPVHTFQIPTALNLNTELPQFASLQETHPSPGCMDPMPFCMSV